MKRCSRKSALRSGRAAEFAMGSCEMRARGGFLTSYGTPWNTETPEERDASEDFADEALPRVTAALGLLMQM
jgi:hypothetical protein